MYAIVSLLDNTHYELIKDLWSELEDLFGLRGVAEMAPFPHITYNIIPEGDLEAHGALLQGVALKMP